MRTLSISEWEKLSGYLSSNWHNFLRTSDHEIVLPNDRKTQPKLYYGKQYVDLVI